MRLLHGVRVLEVGGFITGPLAAMILGEYGADVIKIERPEGGDPFRSHAKDAGAGGLSPAFQAHNRNKRSIAVDYGKPDGLKVLHALVKTADVFINNNRPGVADKMGFSPAQLRQLNARLIYCAITGFGPDGPYAQRPAFDNVGQAISDPATSYYAASAVLAALFERERSGKGRLVEVNMLEATIALNLEPLTYYFTEGEPAPLYQRGGASQAYNLVCKDGKCLGLHMSSPDKFWQALCRAIERPDWATQYATRANRVKHYESIAVQLKEVFAKKTRAEWMARLEREDVPFAPELGVQEIEHDPQVKHLRTVYSLGKIKAPHRPAKVDGSREIDFRPPPGLGEHTGEILAELREKGAL